MWTRGGQAVCYALVMRTDRAFTEEYDDEHQIRYPSILNNEEYQELQQRPAYMKWGKVCPTCEDTGTYRWQNKDHACEQDFDNKCIQWKLFRMYELSNIDDRYQRLNWESIGNSQNEAKILIDSYVKVLPTMIKRGRSLYIFSKRLGTGKTFCATHILKEAAKMDRTKVIHRGYFVTFEDLLDSGSVTDSPAEQKMLHTHILAIDDVTAPTTPGQQEFFPRTLEKILRYRSSNNLPTIITSNLTWKQFEKEYPRCHSVMADSITPIELDGSFDHRVKTGEGRVHLSFEAEEVPPIT